MTLANLEQSNSGAAGTIHVELEINGSSGHRARTTPASISDRSARDEERHRF